MSTLSGLLASVYTGATGARGATGIPGASGASGATGFAGATGIGGASGATGFAGATGIGGATGTQGASGPVQTNSMVVGIAATGATGFITASGGLIVAGGAGYLGATGTTSYLGATGLIYDSKGDIRAASINTQTAAYVAVVTDAGKTIFISTGGVTINASIFNPGDMVTIVNNSASNQTITAGTSVTFRLAGTANTGNRTLAQYGMATFLCVIGGATPTFHCSGAGLT